MLKTCYIVNQVDHRSLVLGMLAYLNLKKVFDNPADSNAVGLIGIVDVRDPLPAAEEYIVIGNPDDGYDNYYGKRLRITDVIYQQNAEQIENWFVTNGQTTNASITKWVHHMNHFMAPRQADELKDEELVAYYRLVSNLFLMLNHYAARSDAPLHFDNEVSEESIKQFQSTCGGINRTINEKVYSYRVGDRWFSQFQHIDTTIFNIQRLIAMSKRNWLHLSMGAYGAIVTSNTKLTLDQIPEITKNCLLIS